MSEQLFESLRDAAILPVPQSAPPPSQQIGFDILLPMVVRYPTLYDLSDDEFAIMQSASQVVSRLLSSGNLNSHKTSWMFHQLTRY